MAQLTYPGVYVEEIPSGVHSIIGTPTAVAAFIGYVKHGLINEPVAINNYHAYEVAFGGLSENSMLSYAVRQFFMNGGSVAVIVGMLWTIDEASALASALATLAASNVPFNLLCIPPTRRVDDPTAHDIPDAIWAMAQSLCADRRAMLIVNPSVRWKTVADVLQDAHDTTGTVFALRHPNAALYYPNVLMPDPLHGNMVAPFVPCGVVAGIMVRTDATRGVWKAPVGIDALCVGVHAFTFKITDGENGMLTPRGINCLRALPGAGHVVWGARTLVGVDHPHSDWKYLPVRRLALYLEQSIHAGTVWATSEVNDESLWVELRRHVGAFMHQLYRQGAFQGRSPREAYFVKCDEEVNPANRRDTLTICVGFAPLKPTEFIAIEIRHSMTR